MIELKILWPKFKDLSCGVVSRISRVYQDQEGHIQQWGRHKLRTTYYRSAKQVQVSTKFSEMKSNLSKTISDFCDNVCGKKT